MYKCNVCGNSRYFTLSGIKVIADISVDDVSIHVNADKSYCQEASEDIIFNDPDNARIKCVCGNDFLWRHNG